MKEKINSIQLASIFTLLIFSSSIGISLYTTIKIASIDSYISVFLGGLLGIIPLLLVLYIFNYDIDKPIYKKNKTIFGHFLGNIINIIILLLYLIVAATILFNTSNFIVSQYLSDTPLILIMIILMLIILYTINKGIETISRTSAIFVIITLFFFLFGICGTLSEIKIENLKPFLEFGIEKPLIGSFVNMLISTAPIYTILIIPKNNLCDNKKTAKYLFISYAIAATTLFLISFIANSILGKYLIELYQFPGYIALKRISLFGFIDRIENFLSLQWILSSFITLSMIIYYISKNIKRSGKSKLLNTIIVIITILVSYNIFKNNTSFNSYLYEYYPYILSALLIMYIVITLTIFIRKKLKK